MAKKKDPLRSFLRDFRDCCIELRRTLEALGVIKEIVAPSEHQEKQEKKEDKYDPYKVLGVSRGDSLEKIEKVYKRLAKIYHPDSETGNEEMFRRIREAYERIKRGGS